MHTPQLPPQNIEAEESIISSCLKFENDVEIAVDILTADDFYRTAHQKIFQAIIDMANHDKRVDLVSIATHLKEKNELDDIGGATCLARISDTAPIASNIELYCQIVKNCSLKRKVLNGCHEIINQCFDKATTGDEVLENTQHLIVECETETVDQKPVKAGSVCVDVIDRLEKINRTTTGITGLETKFKKFDELTGGLQDTDLYVFAGRPGMGKTAFALDVTKALCEEGHPVLFESLEMEKQQLVMRMASKLSRVDSKKFRAGGIEQQEWMKIMSAMNEIENMPLYIDNPKRDNDFDVVRRKIKRAKREYGIVLAIIDYLQLFTRKIKYDRYDLLIGSITRDLKNMATELNIPIILLSQLNRGVEARTDKRPMLSDLKESSAIEQDADMVGFLYRDEFYNKNSDKKGVGELLIHKYRHGPTGLIDLRWEAETATYQNLIEMRMYQNQSRNYDNHYEERY